MSGRVREHSKPFTLTPKARRSSQGVAKPQGSPLVSSPELRERCPHCNADLDAGPIPGHLREFYSVSRFSRAISLYDIGKDRTISMQCPDCKKQWQPGAEKYVEAEFARRQLGRKRNG